MQKIKNVLPFVMSAVLWTTPCLAADEAVAFVSAIKGEGRAVNQDASFDKLEPGQFIKRGQIVRAAPGANITLTLLREDFHHVNVTPNAEWDSASVGAEKTKSWFRLPQKPTVRGGNWRGLDERDYLLMPAWTSLADEGLRLRWGSRLCKDQPVKIEIVDGAGTALETLTATDRLDLDRRDYMKTATPYHWRIECDGQLAADGAFQFLGPEAAERTHAALKGGEKNFKGTQLVQWKAALLTSEGLYQGAAATLDQSAANDPASRSLLAYVGQLMAGEDGAATAQ